MEKSNVIIATHAVFLNNKDIYGPPHAISHYLNKNKISHYFIKHNLYGDGPTVIEYYENGELKNETKKTIYASNSLLRYFKEFVLNYKYISKGSDLYIGVDPLNAFAGNIAKQLKKVKKTVYFSADFAIKRFDSPLMNNIYHFLDKRAMFWCDQTWSVSKRIVAYRKKHGLSDKKNKLMPNAPFFYDVKREDISNIHKHDLVIVSAIEKGIAFELLIDVLSKLKKKIPDTRLLLIGSGSKENDLKKYIKQKNVEKSVKFLGAMSHEEMFKILVKAGIGIAFYTHSDPTHFRYFSDPMKVRDYLASGLPAFVSGNSAIGEEIEKENAGRVVELNEKDIYTKLLKTIQSEKLYTSMRRNALNLAKKYDTYNLLSKLFHQLLNFKNE